MSSSIKNAASLGIARCHACGTLSRVGPGKAKRHCPLCRATVHLRKPHSIVLTWLYTLAATVLYIPANILPMMNTRSFMGAQSDTIFSGICYLWETGSVALSAIVFIASIAVPCLKLGTLYYLLISVMHQQRHLKMQRTKLYRLLEMVGRWSMLDIFVVTVTVALVSFPGTAEVTAGPGAGAFGAVVVLTLLATERFDPRLIWDAAAENVHTPLPTPQPSPIDEAS